ncbi:MAG: tRNA ((6)-L-threonylcarbamoyladenosine(37)-C(2))-methylthiotransferase MtaB [Bacteroidota bacterium]
MDFQSDAEVQSDWVNRIIFALVNSEKTIALHTLGCKLNFSETSTLARTLEQDGFIRKEFEEKADIYVINTCSVTENADKECKQLVRRIQKKNEEAIVVITGCYAQLKPKEIAEIPGVDLVLGAAEKFNIAEHIKNFTKGDSTKICSCEIDSVENFTGAYSLTDRTRTFLKVQDGCDYSCSFCTIPLARGKSRSNTIDSVLEQVKSIGEQGVKEIVLTGVNLGDFGLIQGRRVTDFFELCKALDTVEGIDRFRISSIEPNLLSDEIIDWVSTSSKFMPHFHIPLQSGSNKILGLMRRRYKRELYAEKVSRIKALMPDCAIGVDVIVGFPSETENDFNETFEFLHQLDVSYLHVFTYSERANTKAIEIRETVPVQVRNERNKILRNLSFQKSQYFKASQLNKTRPVLFEQENRNGLIEGYTDNYIRIATPFREDYANQIVDWKIR